MLIPRSKSACPIFSVLLGVSFTAAVFGPVALQAAPPIAASAASVVAVRNQRELDVALQAAAQIRVLELSGAGPFALNLKALPSVPEGALLTIRPAAGSSPVITSCELDGVSRVRVQGLKLDGVRVRVVGGQNVAVVGNVFRGAKGAVVAERVRGLLVEGNQIGSASEGPAGNGIRLTGCVGATVRNNRVRHAVSQGSGECITLSGCESVEVAYNLVSDRESIAIDRGGEGIDVKGSRLVDVHDNVVRGNPRRPGIYIDSYDGTNHQVRVYNNVVYSCLSGIVVSGEFQNLSDRIEVRSNLVLGIQAQQIALADYSKRKSGALPCRDVQFRDNTAIRTLSETREWNLPVSIDTRAEAGGPAFRANEGLVVENNRGYDLPAGNGGVWGRCVGLLEPRLSEGDLVKRKLQASGTQRAEILSDAEKARNQKTLDSSLWLRQRNEPGRNQLLRVPSVSQIRMAEIETALERGLQGNGTPYENVRTYLSGLGLNVSASAQVGALPPGPNLAARHEFTAQSAALQISNEPQRATEVAFAVPARLKADLLGGSRIWKAVLDLPALSEKAVNRAECWYEVRGRKADGTWTSSSFGWMPRNNWKDQQCANLGPILGEVFSGPGVKASQLVLRFQAVTAPGLVSMEPLQVGAGVWKLGVQLVQGDGSYSRWPGVEVPEFPKETPALDWLAQVQLEYGSDLATAKPVNRPAPIAGRWEFVRIEKEGKPVLRCRFVPADTRYEAVTRDLLLAIQPRPLTVTAPQMQMIYGDPLPPTVCAVEGALEADRAILQSAYGWEVKQGVYGPQGRLSVGDYAVEVTRRSGAGSPTQVLSNYRVTVQPGRLRVGRAAAQFAVKDASKFVGDANPVFDGVWSGFRPGETLPPLDAPVRIWTEAGTGSAAGSYMIRAEGPQVAGNYQLVYRAARMQVFAPAVAGCYVGLSERNADNGYLGQRVIIRVMASGAYSLQMRMGTKLSGAGAGRLRPSVPGSSILESDLNLLGGDFAGVQGRLQLELANDGYFAGNVFRAGQEAVPVRGWICTRSHGQGSFAVSAAGGETYEWVFEAAQSPAGILRGALPSGMGFRQMTQGAGPGGEVLVYSPMARGGTLVGVIQAQTAERRSGTATLWIPGNPGWEKSDLTVR